MLGFVREEFVVALSEIFMYCDSSNVVCKYYTFVSRLWWGGGIISAWLHVTNVIFFFTMYAVRFAI
jgi:hypothetical protein